MYLTNHIMEEEGDSQRLQADPGQYCLLVIMVTPFLLPSLPCFKMQLNGEETWQNIPAAISTDKPEPVDGDV